MLVLLIGNGIAGVFYSVDEYGNDYEDTHGTVEGAENATNFLLVQGASSVQHEEQVIQHRYHYYYSQI